MRKTVDRTGNQYCGPLVLAAILGISTGEAAAKLREATGRPRIKSVWMSELIDVLEREKFVTRTVYRNWYKTKDAPTLARWLRERNPTAVKAMHIVQVTRHFMLVQGRQIVDTYSNGEWVFLRKAACRRRRVARVLRVTPDPRYHKSAQSLP